MLSNSAIDLLILAILVLISQKNLFHTVRKFHENPRISSDSQRQASKYCTISRDTEAGEFLRLDFNTKLLEKELALKHEDGQQGI